MRIYIKLYWYPPLRSAHAGPRYRCTMPWSPCSRMSPRPDRGVWQRGTRHSWPANRWWKASPMVSNRQIGSIAERLRESLTRFATPSWSFWMRSSRRWRLTAIVTWQGSRSLIEQLSTFYHPACSFLFCSWWSYSSSSPSLKDYLVWHLELFLGSDCFTSLSYSFNYVLVRLLFMPCALFEQLVMALLCFISLVPLAGTAWGLWSPEPRARCDA